MNTQALETPVFALAQGSSPLLISMPHVGTFLPAEIAKGLTDRARDVEDTDWHLPRLYQFAKDLGASVLQAKMSRYVIDLNRPPDDTPMYPGASNTELCPTRFFTGDPLYLEGHAPDAAECQRRRANYWQPYHDALAADLQRIQARHGYALLWDAHSIRSQIPWLFEGRLPDLNIGTASGASADARITQAVMQSCAHHTALSSVANGRFKGGYITRHYGQPANHIHTIQLEMCQCLYMSETAPFNYDETLAQRVQPALQDMLQSALKTTESMYA